MNKKELAVFCPIKSVRHYDMIIDVVGERIKMRVQLLSNTPLSKHMEFRVYALQDDIMAFARSCKKTTILCKDGNSQIMIFGAYVIHVIPNLQNYMNDTKEETTADVLILYEEIVATINGRTKETEAI